MSTIRRSEGNLIGPILVKDCFLHEFVEVKIERLEGLERMQIIYGFLEKKKYRELKNEARDQEAWKQKYGKGDA